MKKAIAQGILVTSIVAAHCFTACNSNTNGSSALGDTTTTKESSSTPVGGSL